MVLYFVSYIHNKTQFILFLFIRLCFYAFGECIASFQTRTALREALGVINRWKRAHLRGVERDRGGGEGGVDFGISSVTYIILTGSK